MQRGRCCSQSARRHPTPALGISPRKCLVNWKTQPRAHFLQPHLEFETPQGSWVQFPGGGLRKGHQKQPVGVTCCCCSSCAFPSLWVGKNSSSLLQTSLPLSWHRPWPPFTGAPSQESKFTWGSLPPSLTWVINEPKIWHFSAPQRLCFTQTGSVRWQCPLVQSLGEPLALLPPPY